MPAALITADRSPQVRKLADDRGIPIVAKPVKPAALRAVISALAVGRLSQTGLRAFDSNASN